MLAIVVLASLGDWLRAAIPGRLRAAILDRVARDGGVVALEVSSALILDRMDPLTVAFYAARTGFQSA